MYKHVLFIILFFINSDVSAQINSNISIYDQAKKVGYLYQDTNYECETCYADYSLSVLKNKVSIKIPIQTNGRMHNSTIKNFFNNMYTIEKVTVNKKTAIIKFNSVDNGNSYWLYISKINNDLFITKKFKYSNGVYEKKISQKDFNAYPSTLICTESIKIKIEHQISFLDEFDTKEKNYKCFHCPTNYSIDECLKIKQKNGKFIWN